jgi:hypothetical protein
MVNMAFGQTVQIIHDSFFENAGFKELSESVNIDSRSGCRY